jgi:hypothetical protein
MSLCLCLAAACSNDGDHVAFTSWALSEAFVRFGKLRRREAATLSGQGLQLRPQTGTDVQRAFIGCSVN